MRNVERSIRWAVGVALAACTPAQPAPPPELAATNGPSPADSAASASATPTAPPPPSATASAGADSAASASATPTATVVDAGPVIDARALCTAYRAKAAASSTGPTHQNPTQERTVPSRLTLRPAGDVDARVQSGKAWCRITWESAPIQRTAMVAPRCCPPIVQPCPGPSPVTVPAERTKHETAVLRSDGSVESSTVEWLVWVGSPPQQPYCGRSTDGVTVSRRPAGASPLGPGRALAEMAELEAVSVRAFARLARELAAFGAPAELVARVHAARADELRHARAVARLARRHDARPRPVRRARLELRSRIAVARENAVEGCVHETYGAAVATWHAATATEPELARLFTAIARDERAHAALAWDVARWLERSLTSDERSEVDRARHAAITKLRGRPTVAGPLGVPAPAASALVAALFP